jgi:class 3 adenylate cyclase
MKRKIAAILAADIAGYSRLVAEDEEETLRRLQSYRSVTDDFIARYGGRIFNTAGDAVLAEFPSAVEAVRCAIDIQESLRTRNMAYPPSRHMSFRIGITIGDVVERDGDLLGDGVNIAARLEGLAEVGGICISRSVHEQVANKLSVQFADIGAQEVKNIPTPIHAFMVAMRREDGTYSTPRLKKPVAAPTPPNWMWPAAVALVCIVAIGVAGFIYLNAIGKPAAASAAATAAPTQAASTAVTPPAPVAAAAPQKSESAAPPPSVENLALQAIPLISDRNRATLANEYVPAAEHKALAISTGPIGFVTNQQSDEAAKNAALDLCQKRADALQPPRKCEIYAVGDAVVYTHGRPQLPPKPWIAADASIEKPFASKDVPLIREAGRASLDRNYMAGRKARALAIGPGGQFHFYIDQETPEEAARRSLENCGYVAGVPCMVVAVDDVFVVPLPSTQKVVGFFHAAGNSSIAPDARDDVTRRLGASTGGWNAVATGVGGRPGLALKAANEPDAVNAALSNCAKQDRDCHVIAIGPFQVGPN